MDPWIVTLLFKKLYIVVFILMIMIFIVDVFQELMDHPENVGLSGGIGMSFIYISE